MAISGTLGAMLQGVSQQPIYVRSDGQVTAQVNMIPDVTRGLTTRPAARLLAGVTPANDYSTFLTVELKGVQMQLGLRAGEIIALTTAGVAVAMTSGSNSYISENMRAYVYDDQIYLVNRDTVVLQSTTTVLPTGAGNQTATVDSVLYSMGDVYVTSIGGKFGVTYSATLTYSDGATAVGEFTTPDGTTAADVDKITSTNIISELKTALDITKKASTTISIEGSVLRATDTTFNMSIRAEDGDGGTTFRAADLNTKTITDIPVTATPGQVLRVTGENAAVDDLWFRFTGAVWGERAQWVETFNPQEARDFDLTTMPHVLTGSAGSGLTLAQGNWQGRRTGDDVTNPMPSFTGQRLRDITGFQSRIVVVSENSVVMSRTNIPVDFFRSSAAERLVTDRIDIISTTESDYSLEWILPFDRDLICFGKRSQFLISGAQAITPSNASIVETTNFETSANARPVSTGRTVLFPFIEGAFAGVKEFYSSNSVDANEAISITKVQSRYIPGDIIKMENSTNFSLAICFSASTNDTLYGYQYYFDGEQKVQSAWFKMIFVREIVNFAFNGSQLTVLMKDGLTLDQFVLDFDLPDHAGVPYHVCLDDLYQPAAAIAGVDSTETKVSPLRAGASFVQGTGCAVPGQTVTPLREVSGEAFFDSQTVPIGARVWGGSKYERSVTPTMPIVRDSEGKPISKAKLVIGTFIIYFENSGALNAVRSSIYRALDLVRTNSAIPIANDPEDPAGTGVKSGEFRVSWGERSDRSELKITSDDVRPLTITEVEWEGQILSRGRRM